MTVTTKQDIIDAIQRTAEENGGKPLGTSTFEKETGIKPHEWERYWARFGDAQRDAGFEPNQRQGAHTDDFMIKKLIGLVRKLRRFPTVREISVERNYDAEFPSKKAFQNRGTQVQLADKVIEYCKGKAGHDDVIALCQSILNSSSKNKDICDSDLGVTLGELYLFKSGRHYKIGKTKDTVRRGSELRIQLPEKIDLIHSIKTDDPSGIEAYWHKRFETKRMNGEWFDLNASDIKAFRRWRRIV